MIGNTMFGQLFPRRSTLVLVGAGLLAVGGVAAARNADALIAVVAPPAPVIAVIDLQKVFAGLEERITRQADLEGQGKTMQEELDRLLASGKDEATKADALPNGPDKAAAIERLAELQLNLRVRKELFENKLDQRRAETFRVLYAKIADATKRMAQQNKYTMVLTTDDAGDLPAGMTTQDTQKGIGSRRVVFVDAGHDVSAELVGFMNTEFRAAGAKPAR